MGKCGKIWEPRSSKRRISINVLLGSRPMPIVDSASMSGLLSTPLVVPAPVAGALAALFLVMVVMAVRRAARGDGLRLLLPLSVIVVCALAAVGIIDRLAMNERTAEQRALLQRDSQLSMNAITPVAPRMPRWRCRRAGRKRLRASSIRGPAKHGESGRLYHRATFLAV